MRMAQLAVMSPTREPGTGHRAATPALRADSTAICLLVSLGGCGHASRVKFDLWKAGVVLPNYTPWEGFT